MRLIRSKKYLFTCHKRRYHDPSHALYAHDENRFWTFFVGRSTSVTDRVLSFYGEKETRRKTIKIFHARSPIIVLENANKKKYWHCFRMKFIKSDPSQSTLIAGVAIIWANYTLNHSDEYLLATRAIKIEES